MIPVYRLVNRLANRQRREFEKIISRKQYSPAQGRVLHYLLNSRDINLCQKDIEEEFGIRPSSASALIKSLEEGGLVTRTSSDEDARVKYVRATEKAAGYESGINGSMDLLEKKMTEGISAEELKVWERVSLQLMKNLDSKERE